MAFSKYYTDYQSPQARQNNTAALLEELRKMQQQQQAQNQQSSQPSASDFNNIGKMAKMGKNYFSAPSVPQGGGQSFGGGNSAYGGIDMPTSTAQSLEMPAAGGESWYSNLFEQGGDMFGAGGTAAGGNANFGGAQSAGYAMADKLFGDKFYGKQEDDYHDKGKRKAKDTLTSAAYMNPISTAALWGDRVLFKGKVMDNLTNLIDGLF